MNKYGFAEHDWQETLAVFKKYPEIEKVVLFGSRAKNTFKPMSDVDIVLFGDKIDYSFIARIKSEFEESKIPYFFDILDYKKITSDDLKKHVQIHGRTIYP